jgi:hypothetical protein
MYKVINLLPQLLTDADKFVLHNDRELYRPFFQAIEKHCVDECVIGGKIGIDLLLGAPLGRDSWYWELYCRDPYRTGRAIADSAYACHAAHIDNRTVNLTTELRSTELTLWVNARRLCRIFRVRDESLLEPVTASGYFGSRVQCVGLQVQMETLYHNLYSPSKFSLWEQSLAQLDAIWKLRKSNVAGAADTDRIYTVGASGDADGADIYSDSAHAAGTDAHSAHAGGDSAYAADAYSVHADGDSAYGDGAAGDTGYICEMELNSESPALSDGGIAYSAGYADASACVVGDGASAHGGASEDSEIGIICALDDAIFIGSVAMRAMGLQPSARRLQAISHRDPEDIRVAVSRALADAGTHGDITYVAYDLRLVGDFRLKKYTFYVANASSASGKVAVLDVFNATEHELVPYTEAKHGGVTARIGTAWVCARFRLVDAWSLRIIASIQSRKRGGRRHERRRDDSAQCANAPVSAAPALRDLEALQEYAAAQLQQSPDSLFPIDTYLGVHIAEDVSKKQLIADTGERFSPYYPAKNNA